MGSRNPQKEMLKNIGAFETCTEVIDHALKSAKTKVKKLEGLKEELKTFFYRFDEACRLYKVDVIGTDCKISLSLMRRKKMVLTSSHSMRVGQRVT